MSDPFYDPDDPLFSVVPPAGTGEPVSAAEVDSYLYEDTSG